MVAKKPKVDRLVLQYRAHPITNKLKRLREVRALYVSAIKFELKKVAKLDISGENSLVLVLESEINRFFNKLYESKNEIVMHQKIVQFISEVETNVELNNAMRELNFMELLGNLELTLADIVTLLNARTASIAQRPKLEISLLKREIIEVIRYLFSEIELAQLKNPELEYSELVDELNTMLRNLAMLVNRRQSYNQRKAEGLIDEGENNNESDTPEGDNPDEEPNPETPTNEP